MAWTTPTTWTAGSVVTASDLNAQIRDNLLYLLVRPGSVVKRVVANNGSYSTSGSAASFAYIDTTNLSITMNTSGGNVIVGFSAAFGNGPIAVDFDIDGTRYTTSNMGIGQFAWHPNNGVVNLISYSELVTGLSVGSHTLKAMWKGLSAGTVVLWSGTLTSPTVFWAMEV